MYEMQKSVSTITNDTSQMEFWLRVLETAAILGVGTCQWFFPDLIEKVAEPPNISVSTFALLILLALSVLSVTTKSLPLRVVLLASELLVVAAGSVFGIPRLWDVLFMLVLARAGLWLNLRALLISWVVALAIYVTGKEVRYLLTQPAIFSLSPAQHITHLIVFGRLINFQLQIIFASLCTFALSREHDARLEREQLNAEIAELSKKVERLRLSRDIHDSVGHFMTSICQQLDFAASALAVKPEKAHAALNTVRATLQQLECELQQFAHAPESSFDFAKAFAELAMQYRAENTLVLDVDERNFSVPPQLGYDLFYVVKESLHNAKKYAQASKVTISLIGEGDTLRIDVRDDGIGFDPEQVGPERFGLRGMRERLETAGGELSVRSAPGEGTNICIKVPIRNT